MLDDTQQIEELKAHLLDFANSNLEKDRHNKKMYQCPYCGSGSHGGRNSDGAFSIKGNLFKCFSCNKTGDIFTLAGKIWGLDEKTGFVEIKNRLSDLYGVMPVEALKKSPAKPVPVETPKTDYSDYIRNCKQAVSGALPYLHERGFTDETINKFSLGYDTEHKALVIPYGSNTNYYITRSITEKRFFKPRAEEAGAEPIFNLNSLYTESPCFILESQLDAISIEQVGGKAIAVGGTTGYYKLLEQVKDKKPMATLVISFDNDEKGQEATQKLAKELEALKISYIVAKYSLDKYPEGYKKDCNEYLQSNPTQLKADVQRLTEEAREAVISSDILKASKVSNYLLQGFTADLNAFRASNDRATGFEYLDSQSGGLYNGFYVLGAISSLGKTTFVHQIADQLAEAGEHILYFSLEQSRLELVTKSLSRIIARKYGTTEPVCSIAIRSGHLKQGEAEKVREAYTEYASFADKISIVQSPFNADMDFIRGTTEDYIKAYGVKPVVIIDYLQIISVAGNMSDKQKIDSVVKDLKKLQTDYSLTLIAISSVNRSNYLTPVDFESFKESGIIEYSADVVYGLQLMALREPAFAKEGNIIEKRKRIVEAKSSNPRQIELVCLKNRYGISNYSSYFDYYPTCDYFSENIGAIERYDTIKGSAKRL